jgi:hypothetical protein
VIAFGDGGVAGVAAVGPAAVGGDGCSAVATATVALIAALLITCGGRNRGDHDCDEHDGVHKPDWQIEFTAETLPSPATMCLSFRLQ